MIRPMTRRAAMASLAALATTARADAMARKPRPPLSVPLWAAQDGEAVVYLFGQIPLRTNTEWLRPAIDAAFASSMELWVENPEIDRDAIDEFARQLSVDRDYIITDEIGEGDRHRLETLLGSAGLSTDALRGRSPDEVYQVLSQIVDERIGADFTAIPEAVFRRRAADSGVPVRSEWGDMRSFLAFQLGIPHEVKLELIAFKLDEADRVSRYDEELGAWLSGDLAPWRELAAARQAAHPAVSEIIGAQRNLAWADQIVELLGQGGRRFACVGLMHLVGPDGVPEQLDARGIETRRL